MTWSWADVYPDHRAITLILPVADAAQLLDAAKAAGDVIAPGVILGLPKPSPSTPAQRMAAAADSLKAMPRDDVPRRECRPLPPVEAAPPPQPVEHLPKPPRPVPVRPLTGERSAGFLAVEKPTYQPPNAAPKQIDAETRALIDEAVAKGRVTRCPPRTFSQEAGEPDAHSFYSRAKRRKQEGKA